jgi:copper chaperone CopZ
MTRIAMVLLAAVVAAGCSKPETDTVAPPAPESPAAPDDSSGEQAAAAVSKTPVAFNVEGAPTVVFDVPDMMCEASCVPTVRETLAEQPGVKDVKVELDGKQATVAVDEKSFDADAAIAALVDLQFTNTKLATAGAEDGGETSTP